jgi:hypothetical protein
MDENTICRIESIVEQIHAEIKQTTAQKNRQRSNTRNEEYRYINFSILSEYNDFQKSLRIYKIKKMRIN